jgi:general secretion pathway protein F
MLQSNINISDALNILIKNKKDKNTIEFLESIKYSLSSAKPIDENLKDFKINYLISAFLKISQDNGNITSNIKIEIKESKKEKIKIKGYEIALIKLFFIS